MEDLRASDPDRLPSHLRLSSCARMSVQIGGSRDVVASMHVLMLQRRRGENVLEIEHLIEV